MWASKKSFHMPFLPVPILFPGGPRCGVLSPEGGGLLREGSPPTQLRGLLQICRDGRKLQIQTSGTEWRRREAGAPARTPDSGSWSGLPGDGTWGPNKRIHPPACVDTDKQIMASIREHVERLDPHTLLVGRKRSQLLCLFFLLRFYLFM